MVPIPQSCLLQRGDAREPLYLAQHSPLHLLHVCRPQAAGLASGHVWALLSTCFCFRLGPEVPQSPGESERSTPNFLVQSLSLRRGNKVVRTDKGERKHPRERIKRKAPNRSRTKCESSVLPSLENLKDLDPCYFPFFPDKENVLLLRRSVPSS